MMKFSVIENFPVWGEPEWSAIEQMKTCSRTFVRGALMADHHKGYAVPIGGVVAYEDAISPSGVGFDIGCGNNAVRVDADYNDVRTNIRTIMDDIFHTLSFGIGRDNNEDVDDPLFDNELWKSTPCKSLKQLARNQLGTIGSGNHYVDIFNDEQQRIWVGVHFGSRGFGYKVASYFLKAAGAKDGMDVAPCVLSLHTYLGVDYLSAMKLAGQYAMAGRRWVCERVVKILGANVLERVENHHNYAWLERHDGRDLWVVRKGATPNRPEQISFVGGTMCENAVILEGVESEESALTLYSTIHGAGRAMGRREAKGKHGEPGRVTKEMMGEWLKQSGVTLRGADIDEAPDCYKRLSNVLQYHSNTVKIRHILTPLGVAMAGSGVRDPYKD